MVEHLPRICDDLVYPGTPSSGWGSVLEDYRMTKLSIAVDPVADRGTVSEFRKRRGRLLTRLIVALREFYGRDIHILDIGGKGAYWQNVDLTHVASIKLQNLHADDVERSKLAIGDTDFFEFEVGDGTDLAAYADQSVDLVHSNSVIEHVGGWGRMRRMAKEVRRVGRAGWIQTPAWEFPMEVHSRLPFIHWLGLPVQASLLRLRPGFRRADLNRRRAFVENSNMLTHGEFRTLFGDADVFVERFVGWPKSYVARWAPPGVALR